MDDRTPRYWPYLGVFGVLCLIAGLISNLIGWDHDSLVVWLGALSVGFYAVGRLAAAF